MTNDAMKLLEIYLQDHDAAAQGGKALAERCAGSNTDNDLGRYLRHQFIPEIESDNRCVEDLLAAIDASPNQMKRIAVRAAEVVGRLKPNGRARSYSPLSRVFELEGLIAGVHAKHQLWVTAEEVAEAQPEHSWPDVTQYRKRAEIQLEELERHHVEAVATAFITNSEETRT